MTALLITAIGVPAGLLARPPAAPAPRFADQRAPEGTGAISGTVVDGMTGQPLGAAAVNLTWSDRQTPMMQMTDAKGRFLFAHLPVYADYILAAGKLGYGSARYGETSSTIDEPRPHLALADGQWLRDLRLSISRLPAISGTVRDDRGVPIVGAYVRVLKIIRVAGQPQLANGPAARTDDRGIYRIAGLRAGEYYVEVPSVQSTFPAALTTPELLGQTPASIASAEARGAVPSSAPFTLMVDAFNELVIGHYPVPPRAPDGGLLIYPITFYPGAGSLEGAATVSVSTGDRADVDFRVTPVRGARVSGVLDGPLGSYEKRPIRLIVPGSEALANGSEVATAMTDARGAFTFINVPAGTYIVDANPHPTEYDFVVNPVGRQLPSAPGSSPISGAAVSVAAGVSIESRPTGSRYFGQTRVTTAGRDVARLVVPLRRTASLSGRLVWEDARSGGQGIIDVSGASGDPSLGYLSSRGDVATPDQFVIDGLLSGEYVFAINRGAAVSGRAIRSITCDGAEYTYAPISITAGTDVADCVVTITSALPTVSGVVADRPGKSAPVEAAVIAFPVQREQWRGYGMRPARLKGFQVRSDGAFQFHTLPAGDYYFIAVPAALVDAWQDPAFLESVASQATRVRLAWGAAAVQNLALQSVR